MTSTAKLAEDLATTTETLCDDPDLLEHFCATGDDWQRRINEALSKAAGLGRRTE